MLGTLSVARRLCFVMRSHTRSIECVSPCIFAMALISEHKKKPRGVRGFLAGRKLCPCAAVPLLRRLVRYARAWSYIKRRVLLYCLLMLAVKNRYQYPCC